MNPKPNYSGGRNITRRDEIDPLPEGFEAFLISNPAFISHLVCKQEDMM